MASQRPLITAFDPAAVVGGTITITGSNLSRATVVSVGGTPVDSFTVVSDKEISAVIAGGTTTGRVAVTTLNGATTSKTLLVILASAPSITVFLPASGKAGDSITLTGLHFTGATVVTVGGTPANFIVESDTILTVIVPAGAVTGTIHVTGPAGTGVSGGTFTYVATPVVASVSPLKASAGATITLHGSGFAGTTGVSVGGTPVTSFVVVGDTTITAVLASGTTGTVAVTNANGTGTSVDTVTFLAAPTITSFTPSLGPVGTLVTITGTNLASTNAVSFGATRALVVDATSTTVKAVVPQGAITGNITIATPGGTVTSSGTFTPGAMPEIDYIEPLFAQIGDTITVKGLGLTGATSVKLGGVACTGVVVGSDTSLTAVIAAATPSGFVEVTTPYGTVTSEQSIAIQAAPTVSSLTPGTGAVGKVITIAGTGFDGITGVSFNATPAAFAVVSPTRIRATVPSGATTGTITVTNAVGTGTSGSFTVL